MDELSATFRQKLSSQAEACARKALERLQKDLQGPQTLSPENIYFLAKAADVLLTIRDDYGKK